MEMIRLYRLMVCPEFSGRSLAFTAEISGSSRLSSTTETFHSAEVRFSRGIALTANLLELFSFRGKATRKTSHCDPNSDRKCTGVHLFIPIVKC